MKQLIVLIFVVIYVNLCLTDDCGYNALNKVIELHGEFTGIYKRACRDLKISSDSYLSLRKKCILDPIEESDIEMFKALVTKYYKSACAKRSKIETCTKTEYAKYRHCIYDFTADHLQSVLSIYKNATQRKQSYEFLVGAQECFKNSLDEIERRGQSSD